MIERNGRVAEQLRRYVRGLRKRDELCLFFDALNESGEAYLFGGAPRDVIFGARRHIHDLDIFVSGNINVEQISRFATIVRRNNFGGLRLYVGRIDVDAWELQKSYAFIQGLYRDVSVMGLLRTVCFSTDGIAVSLKTCKTTRSQDFERTLQSRFLDFVARPKDKSAIVAARIARLSLKLDLLPSVDVADYFLDCLSEVGVSGVIAAEARWGEHRLLNEMILEQMRAKYLDTRDQGKALGPHI